VRFWLFVLIAGVCVRGFYDASIIYKYRLAYGWALTGLHTSEIVLYLWYFVFGLGAVVALAFAFAHSALPSWIEHVLRRVFDRPTLFLAGATLLLLLLVLASWRFILLQSPIADDESTYAFIAQTLLQGRVVNPLPPEPEFFHNQFVILDAVGWYGKYPIGHPALLALGEAVRLRFLVVPLVTCATLLLTWAVGRRLFGSQQAKLGLCMLVLSPHFVLTGATQLSQPSCGMFMMLGLWGMLKLSEGSRLRWALMAGAAWGAAVLVRPFPGVLFLLGAALSFLWGMLSKGGPCAGLGATQRRQRWVGLAQLAVAAAPVLMCAAVLIWVNRQQTGSGLQSGYQVAHGTLGFLSNKNGQIALSVAGALVRQNFWLFGWPLSLMFVFFARGRISLRLFWILIAAEYAYRVLVPKTVVGTTGPIYVTEIVPLLALATASGLVQVKRWLERAHVLRAKQWVVAGALSAIVVSLVTFIPVQLSNIRRCGQAWQVPYTMLKSKGVKRALVFATEMTSPYKMSSWAYYPPNPSPTLDDDIIFVRPPSGGDVVRRALEFQRRHFPDRSPWIFYYDKRHKPVLAPATADNWPRQVAVGRAATE